MSDLVPRTEAAGLSLWEGLKAALDRWLFGPSSTPTVSERALYGAAAVVAGVGTALVASVSWSLSRSWAHYTRGRLAPSALLGQLIVFAPVVLGASATAYFARRAGWIVEVPRD